MHMPEADRLHDPQGVWEREAILFSEAFCEFDVILAHYVVYTKGAGNSFHICCLPRFRLAKVHAHLFFTEFEIHDATGTEAAMPSTGRSANPPNAATDHLFITIGMRSVDMAGWFLS